MQLSRRIDPFALTWFALYLCSSTGPLSQLRRQARSVAHPVCTRLLQFSIVSNIRVRTSSAFSATSSSQSSLSSSSFSSSSSSLTSTSLGEFDDYLGKCSLEGDFRDEAECEDGDDQDEQLSRQPTAASVTACAKCGLFGVWNSVWCDFSVLAPIPSVVPQGSLFFSSWLSFMGCFWLLVL